MARRRKPHKRKTPEQLATQYAEEAAGRAGLDDLFSRLNDFSKSLDAQAPARALIQGYVTLREALKPAADFLNALGEVMSANMRLARQVEDLDARIDAGRKAKAQGVALPPDSVQTVDVPSDWPEALSLKTVLEADGDSRLRQLRYPWRPPDGTVERAWDALRRFEGTVGDSSGTETRRRDRCQSSSGDVEPGAERTICLRSRRHW